MSDFYKLLVVYAVSIASASAQNQMMWFEASSLDRKEIQSLESADSVMAEKESSSMDFLKFEPQQFFVHTNPQVRAYMNGEHLIECRAHINQVGKNTFLLLEYQINSDRAKVNYGNLEKGGKIKITLMNKDHVYLENIERSRGKVKRSDKYTVYIGTYAISKTSASSLRKHNIDKITVLWEEGVEEYQIQNIDLVKNQLNHLAKL